MVDVQALMKRFARRLYAAATTFENQSPVFNIHQGIGILTCEKNRMFPSNKLDSSVLLAGMVLRELNRSQQGSQLLQNTDTMFPMWHYNLGFTSFTDQNLREMTPLEVVHNRLLARTSIVIPEVFTKSIKHTEENSREKREALALLSRVVCFGILLFCLFVAAYSESKQRLKYPFGKASILISWQCGNMEQYADPSPPAPSDIQRDFIKKMISQLVVQYWKRKEGRRLTQADYKRKPEGWDKDVWYGDPSKGEKKQIISMFKGLCNLQEIALSIQERNLIKTYERLLEKQCSKADKYQYAKELQCWVHQKRNEKDVDKVFDRLSTASTEDQNYTIKYILERLKPYIPVPEVSMIIPSRKVEEEIVISQDETSMGHLFDIEPSIDGSDHSVTNAVKVNLQEGHTINSSEGNKQMQAVTQPLHVSEIPVPCLGETGTSNPETTTSCDWSETKVNKRYAEDAELDITLSTSKRQRRSTELELQHNSQIEPAVSDSMESSLNNSMEFFPSDINNTLHTDSYELDIVSYNAQTDFDFDEQDLLNFFF